jgi:hypothetical protein
MIRNGVLPVSMTPRAAIDWLLPNCRAVRKTDDLGMFARKSGEKKK